MTKQERADNLNDFAIGLLIIAAALWIIYAAAPLPSVIR